jgi:alkanesulfonate monooxygenase SsuD/methylene tetrahydromethanopterin reductase-like flavin-dependent oxidoreductase (luciferase family)
MSKLLLGLGISSYPSTDRHPVREALLAERLDFDFVSASDHPVGTAPSFEVMAMLTWVLARTEKIRVATRVLGMPFRRPAVLAKTVQTLQELSGDRLILGLGSGHSDAEIAALGGPPMSAARKVRGLDEGITVMRSAWASTDVNFHGGEHAVDGLTLTPRRANAAPIWLGTYGPKALAVTGRQADGWIPTLGHASPEQIPVMLDRIRTAAVDSGRDPSAVLAIYNLAVRIGRNEREADVVSGSVHDVVQRLHDLLGLGFAGFNLIVEPHQVGLVGAEVLPALRAQESANRRN